MSDDRGGRSGRPYAVELLEQLHPGSPVGPGRAPQPSTRYLVLPSRARPRALVPANERRAAALALARQLSGPGRRRGLARAAAVAAVSSGAADLLAPSLSVGNAVGGIATEVLPGVLHRDDLLLAMPVSPPRANRKPVLQVLDPCGAVLAFAKVGHDDLTRALVRREATALRRVGERAQGCLVVPEVLGLREWSGLDVLVLGAVDVRRPRLTTTEAGEALRRTSAAVVACGDARDVQLASGEHVRRLRDDLEAGGPTGRQLVALVDSLVARLDVAAVGGWHGDLNPGNLALGRATSTVWDWERFEASAPVGFDLLHHRFTSATHGGTPPEKAALDLLGHAREVLGSDDDHRSRDLARLYLITLGARYLVDRQDVAGAADGQVTRWLLPAVADA
ncbi:hypothetical protein WDZ17_13480 [Pseudokineococcus basanitobsidens]|uniref:Phosphotransferase family enzyme n=1 Tax=Pseudokineococcus basanitobsidens TaxID=1926649 RepID=A0ABU8RMM0_9ACTN